MGRPASGGPGDASARASRRLNLCSTITRLREAERVAGSDSCSCDTPPGSTSGAMAEVGSDSRTACSSASVPERLLTYDGVGQRPVVAPLKRREGCASRPDPRLKPGADV
jgi:hypothetical protein